MSILLFPGRHLVMTAFQEQYLRMVMQMPLRDLHWHKNRFPAFDQPLNHIIFAVTSANQENSRYNPLPFHVRAVGIDRFARVLDAAYGITYSIVGIPHYAPTPRFLEHVLKEISEQSEGEAHLTPENCALLSSTPEIIAMAERLGFAVLPAELGEAPPRPRTPIELVRTLVERGPTWPADISLRRELSPTTFDLWQDFPEVPRRVFRLWNDPLLNDEGSLTESRNYSSYAAGMSNQQIIQIKYEDIKHAIVPGKIVDEGCADGSLLVEIARDFPDSDLIGIDIAAEFIARGRERQRAGEYGDTFVHFHQRNILDRVFRPASINTTICTSTLHEVWSYGEQEADIQRYLAEKYRQTARNGRLIVRDVVGPPAKEQLVLLWLNDEDGSNDDPLAEFSASDDLARHLEQLSTAARFRRFARDWAKRSPFARRNPGAESIPYEPVTHEDVDYVRLSLRHAAEFISKKDYVDNWDSEMCEEFAFWDFEQWKQALRDAGFHVVQDEDRPEASSRVYTSEWIVENRYRGKVSLFADHSVRTPLPYPPTNVVLIAEKRA